MTHEPVNKIKWTDTGVVGAIATASLKKLKPSESLAPWRVIALNATVSLKINTSSTGANI